jgi:hypothetical protein
MKNLIIIASIITISLFSNNANGKNIIENNIKQGQKNEIQKYKIVNLAYFWMFDGDCIQLISVSYNSSGNVESIIVCNLASGYVGTTRICPPVGEAYC